MLADLGPNCLCLFVPLVPPRIENLAVLLFFTFLFQLFGEKSKLAYAAQVECAQLIMGDDAVSQVRIQQQVLQMFEFLLQPGRFADLILDLTL